MTAAARASGPHGAGSVLSERYVLGDRIARTGMSSVWRAEDQRLGRAVVVKLMALDLAGQPDARSRFELEARAAAQLSSPHVVTVFDFGTDRDVPYMVLEQLTGEDLQARLKKTARLPVWTCVWIAEQVASALIVAHENGVVHRDIKPSNLFICRSAGTEIETLKVLDFGIAKLMGESRKTQAGTVVGSPLFMSPEQAMGELVDPRSDLYSLATVLYTCLVGENPFAGTAAELLIQLVRKPPRMPSQVTPGIGPRFDAFFTRALAKAPRDRFPDARRFVGAFREAALGLDTAAATVRGEEPATSEVELVPSTVVPERKDPLGNPIATDGKTPLAATTPGEVMSPFADELTPMVSPRTPLPKAALPTKPLPGTPARAIPRTLVSPRDAERVAREARRQLKSALDDEGATSTGEGASTAIGVIPPTIAELARRAAMSAEPEEPATNVASIPTALGELARRAATSGRDPDHTNTGTAPFPHLVAASMAVPRPIAEFPSQAPLLPPRSVLPTVPLEPDPPPPPRRADGAAISRGNMAFAVPPGLSTAFVAEPAVAPARKRRWPLYLVALLVAAALAVTFFGGRLPLPQGSP